MTCSAFWLNVASNSLATLIAGTIIGAILAVIVNRISRREEQIANDYILKISNAERLLMFLDLLQAEIEDIIVFFTLNKTKIDDIGQMNFVKFNASYWEILKSSGEIPVLFDRTSLKIFTNFYYSVEKCNWLYEQFLDAENNGRANIEMIILKEYKKEIHSIQTAINTTQIDLIIKQVIEIKTKEIESLEESKKGRKAQKKLNS